MIWSCYRNLLSRVFLFTPVDAGTTSRSVALNVDHMIANGIGRLRRSVIDLLGTTNLPAFDRIRAKGAYTNNARTLLENAVAVADRISLRAGVTWGTSCFTRPKLL